MRTQFLTLAALLAPFALASPPTPPPAKHDPAPLAHEHAGHLFNHISHTSSCVSGVLTNGTSSGVFESVRGVNTYLAYPPHGKNKTDVAILYLTDIFGVSLVNNRLLADSLALAGYLVVQPDLFNGDPVPVDAMASPSFNMTAWQLRHPPAAIEAIVTSTIAAMREDFCVKKIGAVGYCFGGKYVTRFLAAGRGLDAGFAAHPSGVISSEWEAVAAPLSIAFGALDALNLPAQRAAAEAIFSQGNKTFQTSLYAGASHGFAVRANLTDPLQAFAQEGAYFQAVRWLDAWVK